MAGELTQFDPDRVTVVWSLANKSIDLTPGLMDGAGAIQETKDAPPWTRRGDRQGNMVRIKSSKKGGQLQLTYAAEAKKQGELTTTYVADQIGDNQVGIITVRDLNGTTLMTYVGAFIENDPDVGFGDVAADRVYVFGFAERIPGIGGADTL